MKKEKKNIIVAICLILLIIFVDLFSKYLINKFINVGEEIVVINNFFSLTYSHNYGAAFGILNGEKIFIILVSIVMLIYLGIEIVKNIKSTFSVVSSSLIIGGLLGNLYDRVFLSYVRDFLDFTIFGIDTAIFNVADACIVVGVILLLLYFIKEEEYGNKGRRK